MKEKCKSFLKSNAFKSVAVLLIIVLLSGALLAVFNDLLYVSAEEKFARTLTKIYGRTVQTQQITFTEEESTFETGTVDEVYLADDGNYLIRTTGKNGFSGGTVTLWTVIACEGAKADGTLNWTGIEKVVYESNEKQSYASKIKKKFYTSFTVHDEEILAGKPFTADKLKAADDDSIYTVSAGVSYSSTAICNAVNTAISYFKTSILGGSI